MVTIWNTVRGAGPFAQSEIHHNLILLQTFTAILASTAMLLSAAIAGCAMTALSVACAGCAWCLGCVGCSNCVGCVGCVGCDGLRFAFFRRGERAGALQS